eukprot:TRINITY_DN646_c0_g1_i1.p1 TRINITY_DN646_c0_g1~~TRINITY_DN646_c0_g1_i1.p1  ORF type:complete len:306 (-),score=35.31 TRINITY_DN646_c0_g1_i1:328-1245(-)
MPAARTLCRRDHTSRKVAKLTKVMDFERDTAVPTDSDSSSRSDAGCFSGRAERRYHKSAGRSIATSSVDKLTVSLVNSGSPLWLALDAEGRWQAVESPEQELTDTPTMASMLIPNTSFSPCPPLPRGLSSEAPILPPPGLFLLPMDTAPGAQDALATEYSDAGCPGMMMRGTIEWKVDARKLVSEYKVVVSPSFDVQLAARSVPFKVILAPKEIASRKGGQSFKRSRGKGSIQLKCESADDFTELVEVKFSVGRSLPRGPIVHDFSDSGVCGLPSERGHWNFAHAVDPTSQTVDIRINILCKGAH